MVLNFFIRFPNFIMMKFVLFCWIQTCSLHTGEEGIFFIGDILHWTVVVKLCPQSINAPILSSAILDALSGFEHPFPCYRTHTKYCSVRCQTVHRCKQATSKTDSFSCSHTLKVVNDQHHATHLGNLPPISVTLEHTR